MVDVTSSRQYIQQEETDYRSGLSEALMQKKAGTINYLIDERDDHETRIDTVETSTGFLNTISGTHTVASSTASQDDLLYTCPASTKAIINIMVSDYDATTSDHRYVKGSNSTPVVLFDSPNTLAIDSDNPYQTYVFHLAAGETWRYTSVLSTNSVTSLYLIYEIGA